MKKMFAALMIIGLLVSPVMAEELFEITVKKRIIDGNDRIKTNRFSDPDMPFISIYITEIKSGKMFATSDPSNSSIATRLTGTIGKINTETKLDLINLKKSIGWKTMRVARYYDAPKKTLVYIVYSTTGRDGSYKHSLSAVPLGFPLTGK
jgi:catabolite regulation protein CreA